MDTQWTEGPGRPAQIQNSEVAASFKRCSQVDGAPGAGAAAGAEADTTSGDQGVKSLITTTEDPACPLSSLIPGPLGQLTDAALTGPDDLPGLLTCLAQVPDP
ncbi:hypothetical protein GCM10010394_63130 [Streptomyces crystallinus]|uniref:Uncharacterized protein n=1 Tax=Streptomyces crystallinus TaxID=68191 RepID=A0ABN1GYM3_9ACTN